MAERKIVTDNESLEEQKSVQDLVLVINRAGHIENLFNQIISDYCSPREHAWHFMWSVVLDTSVMSLGAKLKVVLAVAHELEFKLPREALTKVVQLRDSFAHNTTDAHPIMAVGKTEEESTTYNVFYTLDSNGVLKRSKRHDAFKLFNESYETAQPSLLALRDLVKDQIAMHKSFATYSRL